MIRLAGGWGYNNLGDEAILAGYLEALADIEVVVSSVDPDRSAGAQKRNVRFVREGHMPRDRATVTLLGGGGYLNGSWVPEIYSKMSRMVRDARGTDVITHAIEARRFDNSIKRNLASSLLGDADVSVRDANSRDELASVVATSPEIVPDSISLLYNGLQSYLKPQPAVKGKVLLNLLDVTRRGDSDEYELDITKYHQFVRDLIDALGDRALGLIIGDGDYAYQKQFPALSMVQPRTVSDLVSGIEQADAILSVRMHPALLASALHTPVLAVPYCGKVRPTLRKIGVDGILLDNYDVAETLERLGHTRDYATEWERANGFNTDWVRSRVLGT